MFPTASPGPRNKRISVFAALVCIIGLTVSLHAQSPTPNLATSAVCTHNGGGATIYAPANYNDGVIAAQGSLPWGWTSGSSQPTGTSYWISFTWSVPTTVGEITFYHAGLNNRYLAGGTIQYWTGSAWVDHFTFLKTAPYDQWVRTYQFPPVTTTVLRVTKWVMAPVGQTSNPNFREIEIRNVCLNLATEVDFDAPPAIMLPDAVPINYTISQPDTSVTATLTFKLFTPANVLVHSEQTQVQVDYTTVNGTYYLNTSTVPPGFYRVETTFNVLDICRSYKDQVLSKVIMIVGPGQTPCIVWPGDCNNDGAANYADRKALNKYIMDANLRYNWLNGPARYRVGSTNPMDYLTWEPQPGVPWATPEGCYMDTDGNGVINTFDYIAVKTNWMKRQETETAKQRVSFSTESFDLSQNYPNPFNPTTKLQYAVPEKSTVTIEVFNSYGTRVATLVSGEVATGVYETTFEVNGLSSGWYTAVARFVGLESGLAYNKTVRMTLMK